jgi:hypothetical protein
VAAKRARKSTRLEVRTSEPELRAWRLAAKRSKRPLSPWARQALTKEALVVAARIARLKIPQAPRSTPPADRSPRGPHKKPP